MLIIPCPWCGPRDLTEFRYGGEAGVERPLEPARCSDQQWSEYLFYRNNLKGPQWERWMHAHGCRQWFDLLRDNTSHDVLETRPAPFTANTRLEEGS